MALITLWTNSMKLSFVFLKKFEQVTDEGFVSVRIDECGVTHLQ